MQFRDHRLKQLKQWILSFDAIIIPCSSVKADTPMEAEAFYRGHGYYLHQKRLAEKSGKPWYISSTKYGLVTPTDIIKPYNLIWSKQVQNDNCSMRGKDIPIASEEQRLKIAAEVNKLCETQKVLTFCSLHYRKHMDHKNLSYFNLEAAILLNAEQKGIQFLVKTMNELWRQWDEI